MSLTEAPEEPPRRPKSIAQRILPFTTVGVIIAALYVGWTFYSRHESNRKAVEAAQAKQEEATKESARQIFGSGEVKFTTFGAEKGIVHAGETTRLCYGVVNAKSVQIDPPVGETKPTYLHCLDIAPTKTTTYTITAAGDKGTKKTESITIQVK